MAANRRPAMYLGSMDLKTAFDVARPNHSAKMLSDQDDRGWITAALLREMLGRPSDFRTWDGTSFFTSCIRQGTVEAPRHWREMAMEILWNVELEEGSDGT